MISSLLACIVLAASPPHRVAPELQAAIERALAFEKNYDNVRVVAVLDSPGAEPGTVWPGDVLLTITNVEFAWRQDLDYLNGKGGPPIDHRVEIGTAEGYLQWNYYANHSRGHVRIAGKRYASAPSLQLFKPFTRYLKAGKYALEPTSGGAGLRLCSVWGEGSSAYADCELVNGELRILEVWTEYQPSDGTPLQPGTRHRYEYADNSPGHFWLPKRIHQISETHKTHGRYEINEITFAPNITLNLFSPAFPPDTDVHDDRS